MEAHVWVPTVHRADVWELETVAVAEQVSVSQAGQGGVAPMAVRVDVHEHDVDAPGSRRPREIAAYADQGVNVAPGSSLPPPCFPRGYESQGPGAIRVRRLHAVENGVFGYDLALVAEPGPYHDRNHARRYLANMGAYHETVRCRLPLVSSDPRNQRCLSGDVLT